MIAENIKQYMDEKGIKQTAVAKHLGISKVSMSALLNCQRTLKAEEYVGICDFFGVPLDTFVEKEVKVEGADFPVGA